MGCTEIFFLTEHCREQNIRASYFNRHLGKVRDSVIVAVASENQQVSSVFVPVSSDSTPAPDS